MLRYEIVLVVEVESDSGAREAANAAWRAADDQPGVTVVDSLAQERTDDGPRAVEWTDWGEESGIDVRVRYAERD